MIRFFDASALVKRYVAERDSSSVRRAVGKKNAAVARITFAEVGATLCRAAREGIVTTEVVDRLLVRLERDFQIWMVVEIRPRLIREAVALCKRHPLRGFDSVQLAAALTLRHEEGAVELWAGDRRLCDAARAEGVRVQQVDL